MASNTLKVEENRDTFLAYFDKLVAGDELNAGDLEYRTEKGESYLHLAVEYRILNVASLLIAKGMDVNLMDKFGETALMRVLRFSGRLWNRSEQPMPPNKKGLQRGTSDRIIFSKLLLENGANPNIEDKFGNNFFHRAAFDGHHDLLQLLIDFKANINSTNKFGETVLDCVLNSKTYFSWTTESISLLIKNGAKLSIPHKPLPFEAMSLIINAKTALKISNPQLPVDLKAIGCYAVDWKFAVKCEKIIKAFIENGFDVNELDEQGFTPLFYASIFASIAHIDLLLENGANLNFQNCIGYSALHFAANYGKLENLNFLVSKFKEKKEAIDFNSVTIAAFQSRYLDSQFCLIEPHPIVDILIWLQQQNVSLEILDKHGNNLLELACKVGNLHFIRYLIDGNPNLISKSPRLVEYACTSGSVEILRYLVERGMSLKDPAKPVFFASKFGNLEILQFLAQQKEVNWDCFDENGNNSLHIVSEKGFLEVSEFLCNKISVNSRNCLNQTPLILASKFGQFHIVSKLLERSDIQLNCVDITDLNAFDWACWKGDLDCVKLLILKKIRINSSTAFKLAIEGGNQHILSHLLSIGFAIHYLNVTEFIQIAERLKRIEMVKILRNFELSIPVRVDATGLLAIPRSEVVFKEKIGKGSFGKVFKGEWKGMTVAIKQLSLKEISEKAIKDWKKEANILFKMRGPHVVGLLGVIAQEPLCLVLEFLEKGSLCEHLYSNELIEWKQRYEFVFEIAQGLYHLHSENVIHRDLKSPNILIDKNYNLKLSDFGLASLKEKGGTTFSSESTKHAVGSVYWFAPELFQSGAKNTKESDIYAFGMVCFEIIARRMPWQDHNVPPMMSFVLEGKRETNFVPKETPNLLRKIMELCWNQNPLMRPSISQVLNLFKDEQSNEIKISEVEDQSEKLHSNQSHGKAEDLSPNEAESKSLQAKLKAGLSMSNEESIVKLRSTDEWGKDVPANVPTPQNSQNFQQV